VKRCTKPARAIFHSPHVLVNLMTVMKLSLGKRIRGELDVVDMQNAGVEKELLETLRNLIRDSDGDQDDEQLLDIVLGMWRGGK